MKLLCLSDIHGEAAGLEELMSSPEPADVVIVAGDITHLGGRTEAQAVLAPILSLRARLIAVAGNMDRETARGYLGELGVDLHARGIVIEGVGFMGLGGGTPSPFGTPWELDDAEAQRCLEAGRAQISDASFRVLVSHAPPRGTQLDRGFARQHVGSGPVRDFLLAGSVNLCICGHIHESAGEDSLGGASCVNLGPFKNGNYALVTIDGGRAFVRRRTR
ncbi:MAG: metallophosphoesterase [Spirochaetia bacterium]|jgi:Icc-related predicted phosphoesterase